MNDWFWRPVTIARYYGLVFCLLSSSFSFQLILLFNLALVDRSSRYIYVLSVRWMCNSVRSSRSKPLIIAPSHLNLQFCSILVMVRMCFNTTITIFQDFWGSLLYSNVRSIVCGSPLFVLLHWELCVWWSQFVYISSQYRVCNTYPTVLDCVFCAELRVMDLKTLSYIHLCPLSILKKHVKTTSIPYDTTNLYWGSFFLYGDLFFIGTRKLFQAKTFAGQDMFLYTIWR